MIVGPCSSMAPSARSARSCRRRAGRRTRCLRTTPSDRTSTPRGRRALRPRRHPDVVHGRSRSAGCRTARGPPPDSRRRCSIVGTTRREPPRALAQVVVRVQTDPVEHGHGRAEHDVAHQDEHPADVRGRGRHTHGSDGSSATPSAAEPSAANDSSTADATAGRDSSTSFGRPAVPDVATTSPTRSGSGGAGSANSISSSAVMTDAGRARSTIARRSREVRRASSGRTAAPASHSVGDHVQPGGARRQVDRDQEARCGAQVPAHVR